MQNLFIVFVGMILGTTIPYYYYCKERRGRLKAEGVLAILKETVEVDTEIFRIRMDDPEEWPSSTHCQRLIVRRIELHWSVSSFHKNQPLRDVDYISELRGALVEKPAKTLIK